MPTAVCRELGARKSKKKKPSTINGVTRDLMKKEIKERFKRGCHCLGAWRTVNGFISRKGKRV